MKEIALTKGYVTFVDDQDYRWLSEWKWSVLVCGKKRDRIYAKRSQRHPKSGNKIQSIIMHRLIMDCPEDMEVAHVNNDGLDNRRENLKICSRADSRHNGPRHSDSRNKYKGVSLRKNKYWEARIQLNSVGIYLGMFPTEEAAAEAYNKAAKEHFGEFARLNVIKKRDGS